MSNTISLCCPCREMMIASNHELIQKELDQILERYPDSDITYWDVACDREMVIDCEGCLILQEELKDA